MYKNILEDLENQGILNIYSHQLAKMADVTPVQLRRDLMLLSYYGKPTSGYEVSTLLKAIENFIYKSDCAKVALVGLGHVGRAILNYFQGRSKLLKIIASFDKDYEKVNRVIAGCRCYHISEAPSIIKRENIKIAIIAVPQSSAQEVADMLIEAVFEDINVKQDVFRKLDAVLQPNAILASNTSALPATPLASVTKRPDKFMIIHFHQPPTVMRLIELVKAIQTSDETAALAMEFCKAINKDPVQINVDCPGFLTNRTMIPLLNEVTVNQKKIGGATKKQNYANDEIMILAIFIRTEPIK